MVANCELGGIYSPQDDEKTKQLNMIDNMIYEVDNMLYGRNATVSPTKRLILLNYSRVLNARWQRIFESASI